MVQTLENTSLISQAPNISRKSSSATVTQISRSQTDTPSPDLQYVRKSRQLSRGSMKRSTQESPRLGKPAMGRVSSSSVIESSSSSGSEKPSLATRSRTFPRRPKHIPGKSDLKILSDTDEEELAPPFLPFSTHAQVIPAAQSDTSSSNDLRSNPTDQSSLDSEKGRMRATRGIHSSSLLSQSQDQHRRASPPTRPSQLSPQRRRLAKEAGSDGTPSMGSSFSDLDEANVTQSAMEEVLAGEMQTGVVSKMSTISQALRSRYNF